MRKPEDISPEELFAGVKELLNDEHYRQLRSAQARQAYIQRKFGVERRSIDGIGQPVLEVDPVLYHAAARIEEDSRGEAQYGVWQDKTFIRRMKEEGVLQPVRSKGTKDIQVGYTAGQSAGWEEQGVLNTASSGGPNEPRFHKVYG